jgi:hypothetical protein
MVAAPLKANSGNGTLRVRNDSQRDSRDPEALKLLRYLMVLLKKLGYGGYAMGMIYEKPKNKYPEAHEAFEEELRG